MTVDLRSDSSDIKIFYWNVFYPLTDLCWESGCIVLISSNMAAILLSWSLSLVDWVSLQRHKQVIQYTGHIKWIKIISEFYDWQPISKTHSEILQIKHILLLFYTLDTETKNLQILIFNVFCGGFLTKRQHGNSNHKSSLTCKSLVQI